MRILVLDDEDLSRTLIHRLLSAGGHDVLAVDNGSDAIESLVEPTGPGLAVLDWHMPSPDGFEVLQRVRESEHGKQIYIIFATVRGHSEEIVKVLEAGADDYVTKPYDTEELLARVNVGQRVQKLRNQLLASERDRVVLETAGAAAHEIFQPLTAALMTLEVMIEELGDEAPAKGSRINKAISGSLNEMKWVKVPWFLAWGRG